SYNVKVEPLEFKDESIDYFSEVKEEDSVLHSTEVEEMPLLDYYGTDEIKEESVDMKEEPIDEFPKLEQEEPNADMYFPYTGISRPGYCTNSKNEMLTERRKLIKKKEMEMQRMRKQFLIPTTFKPTFNREKIAAMNLQPAQRIEPRKCDL
ncbi:hypothetical protein PMAYCL1PPCAC_24953, partial [Pristionchus mayeri]